MAFTENVIALARETKLLIGLETVPGVQMPPTDPGMHLVLTYQAGSVAQTIRHIPDPQYRNTRSRLMPIVASFDTGTWSFATLIKTVTGAGLPPKPEIDALLTSLFGKAGATDAAWFGATPHRAYKLLGVSAAGTVYPSFTVWFQVGHMVYYCCGATANQGEFTISGNELASIAFSGEFMRMGWIGTDRPITAVGGTELIVADARKYFKADPADHIQVGIMEPDGSMTGPFEVTAIDYVTNTLTLGTAAVWSIDSLVVPILPAGAEVGTPLYGKYGLIKLDPFTAKSVGAMPESTQVISTCKVTINNGIKYYPDLKDGKNYPTQYAAPGAREVSGEIGMFLYRNVPSFMYKSISDPLVPDYVIMPVQDKNNTAGRRVELHIPQAIWSTPTMSGDDDKTVSMPFLTAATTAYDDELALVYAENELNPTVLDLPTTTSTTTTTTTTTDTTTTP